MAMEAYIQEVIVPRLSPSSPPLVGQVALFSAIAAIAVVFFASCEVNGFIWFFAGRELRTLTRFICKVVE
ncbi:hypothetical protein PAXRUDRAFT_833061 [Paxillus rubicundulus Ve08.2h10]|uniref:Unplaced genomic scaffold scaffold_1037, whole genome shotgun sequence n=1 Tax=Paxillus rubicundulus Ve08.2h10 TaxID=930991 RepID=A0A0D0DPW5_9AGAM|nr:hypothetical protein PAXRUDRAFT_833061 [Paxillus rubicundulus Ve08.2h10]